jgi:hypothetical protein
MTSLTKTKLEALLQRPPPRRIDLADGQLPGLTLRVGVDTATFDLSTIEKMRPWIKERNGKKNLYFTVNPALKAFNGNMKPKKTDIRALAWLHVDVDPRVGEPLESERARILRILREYKPPPTVIIDSGGGYQGFWKLSEEQLTNGSEQRAEELEAFNLQIQLVLNADACFNIDRIMRLPGTVNLPNEKKLKRGRKPALASVVEQDLTRVHPLDVFTAAARVQHCDGGAISSGPAVHISSNLPRLGSLDELPEKVSTRTKMLIVQGGDSDDPTKYNSRSEVVYAVTCELVRAECTDDQIAAVLLDPGYGISGHIRAQPRPEKYAVRQIKRAREVSTDFTRNGENRIVFSYANARLALLRLKLDLRHNLFSGRYQVGGREPQQWLGGEVSDNTISMLRQLILDQFGFDPRKDPVRDAVLQLCLENSYDPVVDYLDALVWDEKCRLDDWLADYLGADNTPLIRAFARKMLIAAARRARQPRRQI